MAGAGRDLDRVRKELTGVRNPELISLIGNQNERELNFIGSALMRPGERIIGASLQGESYLRSLVQLPQAPLVYCEIGYWLVPLPSLGRAFVNVVIGSYEDAAEQIGRGGTVINGGAAEAFTPGQGFLQTDQGHLTPGPQSKNRVWAGEIGDNDDTISNAVVYMPYNSFATWLIAESYYDLDWFGIGERTDPDLLDNPPKLGEFVNGAVVAGVSAAVSVDDRDGGQVDDAIGNFMSRMALLTTHEQSYAQYLARNGVDPMRADAMPRPVMLEQSVLRNMGSPQFAGSGLATAPGENVETLANQSFFAQRDSNGNQSLTGDLRPIGALQCTWNRRNRVNMFVEHPSILVGTMCWWPIEDISTRYTHVSDATRAITPGMWGDASFGDPDLSDFVGVHEIRSKDGSAVQAGADGTGGIRMINFLNHYMNGDVFGYSGNSGVAADEFRFRMPGGDQHFGENEVVNSRLSMRLAVATDLVG